MGAEASRITIKGRARTMVGSRTGGRRGAPDRMFRGYRRTGRPCLNLRPTVQQDATIHAQSANRHSTCCGKHCHHPCVERRDAVCSDDPVHTVGCEQQARGNQECWTDLTIGHHRTLKGPRNAACPQGIRPGAPGTCFSSQEKHRKFPSDAVPNRQREHFCQYICMYEAIPLHVPNHNHPRVGSQRMVRPVCKEFVRSALSSLRQRIRVWMTPCLARGILAFQQRRQSLAVVCPAFQRGATAAGPDGCPRARASSVSRVQRPRIRSRLLPARRHGRSLHHASSSRKHLPPGCPWLMPPR
jgi:hypothetical protein